MLVNLPKSFQHSQFKLLLSQNYAYVNLTCKLVGKTFLKSYPFHFSSASKKKKVKDKVITQQVGQFLTKQTVHLKGPVKRNVTQFFYPLYLFSLMHHHKSASFDTHTQIQGWRGYFIVTLIRPASGF